MPKGARITAQPSKYRAVRCEYDGIKFASRKEMRRYQELKLLERAGEISRILCQPSFDLTVIDMSVAGKLKRAAQLVRRQPPLGATPPVKLGRYVADFSYWTKDDTYVVEDVKGFKTPLYRWKKRHVEAQYGIQIREL